MSAFRWVILRAAFLIILNHPSAASAQIAGSPALPSSLDGYVDYAVNNLPSYFAPGTDVGDANNTPLDNPITDAGATLGRVLFYDKRLSHNNSTSCASCHQQEHGFSDPDQFSEGLEGGLTDRHSMGLSNAMFYERGNFFWDERAATLEDQVLAPIENAVEMGSDLDQVRTELADTAFYPELFQDAFGSTEITNDKISKALSQFVRSMVSYQSKFDEAREAGEVGSAGYNNELSGLERLGSNIFHGGGRCSGCHGTDAQIANVPHNIGLDIDNSADGGAGNGTFKVPSLRNIDGREGYMHDGRFSTLEEVVDFYSTGIQANPNLALPLRTGGPGTAPIQFNFTNLEKSALVAFLQTLTDDTFLNSEMFSDPFTILEGDYDDNGIVDADDLLMMQNEFGGGTYTGANYFEWARNFGNSWEDLTTTSVSSSGTIPEPSGLILFFTGCMAWAARRNRPPPNS